MIVIRSGALLFLESELIFLGLFFLLVSVTRSLKIRVFLSVLNVRICFSLFLFFEFCWNFGALGVWIRCEKSNLF